MPRQVRLELLVQHPVEGGLGDAQVARAHALVEAADALLAQNLAHAVVAVAVPPAHLGAGARALGHVLVELHARLDHPYGVGGGRGGDARGAGRQHVHPGRLLAAVPALGEDALAVAVDVKVDGARGHDADEVGAEALEERLGALGALDGAQDVQRVAEVVVGGGEGAARRLRLHGLRGAQLGLVNVGLEAGFENVEGCGEGRGRHATDTSQVSESFVIQEPWGKEAHPPAMKCTQDFANGSALTWPFGVRVSSGRMSPVSRDCTRAACSAGVCEC